jgi:hypothetical protein
MKNNSLISFLVNFSIALSIIAADLSPASSEEKGYEADRAGSSKVEISFMYQKQTGMASNQFAVWIEDSSGKYIKTLYVTRFTANGGWQRRQQALPGWVKASQPLNMPQTEIDAITGATPPAGNLTYVWDCKDNKGNMVASGEYRYIVEATLRWNNMVVYSGTVRIGDQAQESHATSEFYGDSEKERGMITNVAAKYFP